MIAMISLLPSKGFILLTDIQELYIAPAVYVQMLQVDINFYQPLGQQ